MSRLKTFFVVTALGSVYEVSAPTDDDNNPNIEKIANFGKNDVPVGKVHDEGDTIAITRVGVYTYRGQRSRKNQSWVNPLEKVNMRYWLWKTESVAGLFLKKEHALRCGNKKNLILCDPRWKKQTVEVLGAIDSDHPYFTVSQDEQLRISYS